MAGARVFEAVSTEIVLTLSVTCLEALCELKTEPLRALAEEKDRALRALRDGEEKLAAFRQQSGPSILSWVSSRRLEAQKYHLICSIHGTRQKESGSLSRFKSEEWAASDRLAP